MLIGVLSRDVGVEFMFGDSRRGSRWLAGWTEGEQLSVWFFVIRITRVETSLLNSVIDFIDLVVKRCQFLQLGCLHCVRASPRSFFAVLARTSSHLFPGLIMFVSLCHNNRGSLLRWMTRLSTVASTYFWVFHLLICDWAAGTVGLGYQTCICGMWLRCVWSASVWY